MRTLSKLLNRFARSTSGTATIETVIALPLAISLMVGGIEFGRLFSAYTTADKSMRSAARYLARVPEVGVCTWGLTNARNLAMYGMTSPPAGTQPLIAGWTAPATISLSAPACGSFGKAAVLHLSADVPFEVSMLTAIGLPNHYTLTVQHEERHIGE
ncbi:hypothetical protein M2281_005250 [Mesorhizobium soli]|uniref:TadE/TadG family type IV pilus assembly protein n=1 Tax=Pseudaminobacter soli (ex Li et al. 2025) TaxID=1295366 RepID=UPI002475A88A|nr:pilus assembly protein [Mesorhizobium soli]MDH6234632.1 hypothetical protein [Mesorhizobium soli]